MEMGTGNPLQCVYVAVAVSKENDVKNAGASDKIHFDGDHNKYGALVNESPHAIRLNEVTWPSVAHYLLGERFPEAVQAGLRLTCSVDQGFRLIEEGSFAERQKWDVIQDEYVYRGLAAKFTQHLDLEQLLSETGDLELVFANTTDAYYGVGSNGDGHNMLGRLLMRVRRNLGNLRMDYLWGKGTAHLLASIEARVQEDPTDGYDITLLADAYFSLGHFEWAVSAARQALSITDDYEEWDLRILALSLSSLVRDREAIEPLKKLVGLCPEKSVYLKMLATAMRNSGKETPAKVYALRARLIDEQNQKPTDSEPGAN
jgi:ribA/ribD-fused uncharacterized protein